MSQTDFFAHALSALQAESLEGKQSVMAEMRGCLPQGPTNQAPEVMTGMLSPGRPAKPILVDPTAVPRRRLSSSEGQAALIHAIAHIEFNAINLALDALWRFRGMPGDYYADWLGVALDEARHFSWLATRLNELGYQYGDFTAHNGLWEMACKTAHDPLLRMALVPRVLEARGLDVTPGMIQRLQSTGDTVSSRILERILIEEEGHVAIGSRWFEYCCEQRGEVASQTFQRLMTQYMPTVKPPLNLLARARSGFSSQELDYLEQAAGQA